MAAKKKKKETQQAPVRAKISADHGAEISDYTDHTGIGEASADNSAAIRRATIGEPAAPPPTMTADAWVAVVALVAAVVLATLGATGQVTTKILGRNISGPGTIVLAILAVVMYFRSKRAK